MTDWVQPIMSDSWNASLPTVLEAFRPDFLVLVVFYWSIESPRAGGLTLAFMAGLALGSFLDRLEG